MKFTILAAPRSGCGAARTRASAVVAVDGPGDVAAAARACADPYLLLLGRTARPLANAFGGLTASLGAGIGVLGGCTHDGDSRSFGWMLAPASGPLPFELVPVVAPVGEAGYDAQVRGPIDVVAPGMLLVARELLLEPLPGDPVAALLELCERARSAGLTVVCRPSFACEAAELDPDDRGRTAALRTVAERRPGLTGGHRLAPGARRATIERELRAEGGRRVRARIARPALTVLVHGFGAEGGAQRVRESVLNATARAVSDPADALRAELRVRGDRYVLVADAQRLPAADVVDDLIERIEQASCIALVAPDASALDGSCVLLHAGRFPQHVEPAGGTIEAAIASLASAAHGLRLAVRAPGYTAPRRTAQSAPRLRTTAVFLASSLPEVTRTTLDAVLAATRPDDEVVAVCAASAQTVQRLFAVYPHVRVATDAADPLLCGAANRAIGAAQTELVALIADDVLLPPGALSRLRDAFARIPSLGAAFPAIPGALGGEGILDVSYADIAEMKALAQRRERVRARELEPIDVGVTPALVVSREAFEAVGGIDPAHGPTRRGIAGLVTRLRAAGYAVVRCDDALAHRFDASYSGNPAAGADAHQPPVAAPDVAALARGFDPAARVPFEPVRAAKAAGGALHAIAVAVGDPAELERAASFLTAAADAFDAASPVRVHLLLDGGTSAADTVARIRPILTAGGKPIDATVAVRVERVDDVRVWQRSLEANVRVLVAAGHERAAFAQTATVAPHALRELLEPVLR